MNGDRRSFLKVVLAAGGSLALGVELPGCEPTPPPFPPGDLAPNAWVRISPDNGFFFVLDRTEMGQGVATTLTTMVAEELDVAPERFVIENAVANRVYDNPDPNFHIQATGGSSSVRTTYLPLRRAGATARQLIREAAAVTWRVPVAECVAADGLVRHVPSGRTLTYGEVVPVAITLPVPRDPPLKSPAEFRWLGKSIGRLDIRSKIDGGGVYGIDFRLDGLKNACLARPPSVAGRVARFDAARARTMPGVRAIVPVSSGVAVVADHFFQAMAAAKLVTIESDDAPAVTSAALHDTFHARLGEPGDVTAQVGSFEEIWARAPRRLEARYDAPYLAHAALEPMNATAWIHDGRIDVWAPSQASGLAANVARRLTGLPYDKIGIHTTLIGGGFGRRALSDFIVEAVEVAKQVPYPVKVTWTREDDMTHGYYRQLSAHAVRAALDEGGAVLGWGHRIVSQSLLGQVGGEFAAGIVPNALPTPVKNAISDASDWLLGTDVIRDLATIEGTASDLPYAFASQLSEFAAVETGVPIGFWRSVGLSQNVFVVESFLDEIAHAAGVDPLALRLRHAKAPRSKVVLELAAEKSGWETPLPPGRGRGIALSEGFHGSCAQVVEVTVDGSQVKVDRVVCAVDCGFVLNPEIVVAQIESAVAFALSAALHQEITLADGRVQQTNYHQFKVVRMFEMPRVEVHLVPSTGAPTGIGEVGVPALAPALVNAVFAATGKRIRKLPLIAALAEAP